MVPWWRKPGTNPDFPEQTIRAKYASFRRLLSLNNECLEAMAGMQEDLQFAPASRKVLGGRVGLLFDRLECVVAALENLTGKRWTRLTASVEMQRNEVVSYLAGREELEHPPLARDLSAVDRRVESEVGAKAAYLGEIANKLHLPVPDGFVLTAEAYRQFCGAPLWEEVREAARRLDLNDHRALQAVALRLTERIRQLPISRAIEAELTERARALATAEAGLAVRSSAIGEGGERTFAGQFLSLLNVPMEEMVHAYRSVVASRFNARALFYRLSAGLPDVESPMAVLCLRTLRARASGVLYTRDPKNPRSEALWIAASQGLGSEAASNGAAADLIVLSRKAHHPVLEEKIAHKGERTVLRPGGGVKIQPLCGEESVRPALAARHLQTLAAWAVRIEDHFGCPQDVEWALDEEDRLWVVQSRPLALANARTLRRKARILDEPLLTGGRTVYPGRVSGPAHLATDADSLAATPQGAILFLRKASPEIVEVLPRISGLVAEWGNPTGHAAALLREFAIPSVFQLQGVFEKLRDGAPISLDAVQPRLYAGKHWPERNLEPHASERDNARRRDPVHQRMLTLHVQDPLAFDFRTAGCKSAHDILRFCHEKAIQSMFAANDAETIEGVTCARKLLTAAPVNLQVLDLGGGLAHADAPGAGVTPQQILSRPFHAFWRGVTHPGVSWTREIPASFGDLASVMTTSLALPAGPVRALGERSYLLVSDEYMNLNSRLAYHFTLVDACICDLTVHNSISFRFAGGGATRDRRTLRAHFLQSCLTHYGFHAERRGDLVNAWFKKAPAAQMESRLDMLGRLMACSSQLDMYMTSAAAVSGFVQQFLDGNYAFEPCEPCAEQPKEAAL